MRARTASVKGAEGQHSMARVELREVLPTVMDMMALVATLSAAAVLSPALSTSHDRLVEADERYATFWNTTNENGVSIRIFWYTAIGSQLPPCLSFLPLAFAH